MKSIEGNRVTRDNILNEIGAFTRMRQSANDSFWYGRLVHAYITAMIFNLRKKKLFSAISRALFGIISLISAGRHIFSARFWQALRTEYITIHHELINDSEGKS
jgi:hypothetical protein